MLTLRRSGLATLAFVLLAAPSRSAEPDRYLPDGTELVLHVNVRALLDAPLVKKYCLDLVKGYLQGNAEA